MRFYYTESVSTFNKDEYQLSKYVRDVGVSEISRRKPQTKRERLKATIGSRAEINGQSYARRMPYGGARNASSKMN